MCPLWRTGVLNGREWQAITPFPERQPVLGWYDEGNPQVTDWEIKYLLEHGISFGIPCWFRAKDNLGKPVRQVLGHWLHEGLFQCRYGGQFPFAILWENINTIASGVQDERDLLENLLPFWMENYFRRPNYLTIGGKPLLMIYGVSRFIQDLGGEVQAKAAIGKMRGTCRRNGLNGLVVMGEHHGDHADRLPAMARIGLDGVTSYHWPSFAGNFPREGEPAQIIAAQEVCWRDQAKAAVPGIVTVSMGWDSRPWKQPARNWHLAPPDFAELCRRAKDFVRQQGMAGPTGGMVLLDNWNEFGEGHYIFPHRQYGFGHLDAVRAVFAPTAGTHRDLVPEDIGLGPYDGLFRASVAAGGQAP